MGRVVAVAVARRPDVAHVEEGRARQADLDEGRLHARKHAAHAPEVDVADEAAARVALDVQLLHRALLGDRHPRFLRRDVDEDLFVHLRLRFGNHRWTQMNTDGPGEGVRSRPFASIESFVRANTSPRSSVFICVHLWLLGVVEFGYR